MLVLALALWPAASPAEPPVAHAAATCADYPNQAAAQRAADTRDADGDGIYCESLPCPCSSAAAVAATRRRGSGGDGAARSRRPCSGSCSAPSKYPNIRAHFRGARRAGAGRDGSCSTGPAPTRAATGCSRTSRRGTGSTATSIRRPSGAASGTGLERGSNPRGWRADVRYVPSSENRSHGASLGAKLRAFCNGTRFRYVFR